MINGEEAYLSYLPLAHMMERIAQVRLKSKIIYIYFFNIIKNLRHI